MTKIKQETVRIDGELLSRVKKLIKMENKKIKYANKKQFINIAVQNLLEVEE